MKRAFLLIASSLILFSQTALASELASPPLIIPPAPTVKSEAFVLVDANTGKIIAEKQSQQKREPASLTKLMSLYLVFSSLQNQTIGLDDKVRISQKAWKTGGSRMFLKYDSLVPVRDLIQGVIVDSGNDATVALSQYVAGSVESFVKMMNMQAQRLGMQHSHFNDPTGLPTPEHYTTPQDLSILARAIIEQFPEQYHWFSQKHFTYNGIEQPNRNRLLWRYNAADGLKTGHTNAAGYCLIASAKENDMRLIAVVMGAPSDETRAEDSIQLLRYGFRFYHSEKVFDKDQSMAKLRVYGGKDKYVMMQTTTPLYVTTSIGKHDPIETKVSLQPNVHAPIKQGQILGSIVVTQGPSTLTTAPLVAATSDAVGSHWRRISDYFAMQANHYLGDKT